MSDDMPLWPGMEPPKNIKPPKPAAGSQNGAGPDSTTQPRPRTPDPNEPQWLLPPEPPAQSPPPRPASTYTSQAVPQDSTRRMPANPYPQPAAPRSGPPPGMPQRAGGAPKRGRGDGTTPGINTMAIAGLVFAFLLPPVGALMGHVAKAQIRRTGEGGKGVATAALVVGYLLLLCYCGGVALLLAPFGI